MDQPVFLGASDGIQKDVLSRIDAKFNELNTNGITRGDQEILKQRLKFCWMVDTLNRKKGTTLWRNTRARRAYAQIQDASEHLFLIVILAISPTECCKASFDNFLNYLTGLENYDSYRLKLSPTAKRYFESVATEQGFTSSDHYHSFLQALFPPDDVDVVPQSRKRYRVTVLQDPQSEPTAVPELSAHHPKFTGAEEQRVVENASLQGIAKVFDEYMCAAIRRVNVPSGLKAAVTTVLPVWGGPVDCLMSLDICEWEVEQLAMTLFNAEVKWVEQVLHVVLKEGITLIIPHSEITLKGVLDETIIAVFGLDIHNAITDNPVRRRELKEGKRVTECVSMILTKNGAIINLSLGLEGGLQIQKKLFE